MRVLLLAATLTTVAPSHAFALCAQPLETVEVVNAGTEVPAGGGLLILTSFEYANKPPPKRADWKFVVDGNETPVTPVALAPGLEVLRLPANTKAGQLTESTTVLGAVTRADKPAAALAAPVVTSATTLTSIYTRYAATRVTVTLSADAPANAVALILADARTGKAHTFGRVTSTTRSVDVYAQGRCSALPNGTIEPKAGGRFVVRWVDNLGRISPPSKPFKLTKLREPKPSP